MRARRTRFQLPVLVVAGMLSIALVLPPAVASGDVRVPTVASGLKNPRGIFLVTGAVTHVTNGSLDRLVHLPSIATTDGSFAFGPHDVAKGGEGDDDEGALFATVGLGGDAAYKAGFGPKGANLATLVRVTSKLITRPAALWKAIPTGSCAEMTPASSPTRGRTTC